MKILSERNKAILNAVISDYIRTAEPVSSSAVAAKFNGSFCSATVRNTMAFLKDIGYLKQPHKSAGRIPTVNAFMHYINSIMETKSLPIAERKKIDDIYKTAGSLESLIKETSLILSALSTCIGIVTAPRFGSIKIHHLEFIKINTLQIMVVLVSDAGIVQTRVIETDNKIPQHELSKMSEYLNNIAAGRTLHELKDIVFKEMRKKKRLYDKLIKKIFMINDVSVKIDSDVEIYIDGRTNILNQPEFVRDVEKIKRIFKAFERKSTIIKLLNKTIVSNSIQIFMGSDNEYTEINGLGVVSAPYGDNNWMSGTIGIVGPIRMDYSRIIPLVNYTAKLLSKTMMHKEEN